jgi:cytoskeletal protein CcmA (bactofilin family)
MPRKSHEDALGVIGAETVIGTGVVVHGNLTGNSDIIIDGTLDGSVSTTGDVTIGMNGQIKANVTATNITIAGTMVGNIKASGQVLIRETGNVHGDIRSEGLAITTGGVFVGNSTMETVSTLSEHNPLIGDDNVDTLKSNPKQRPRNREP